MNFSEDDGHEVFYGLTLPGRIAVINVNALALNGQENKDVISLDEWPDGTKLTTITPAALRTLFRRQKPSRISELLPALAEARYQGIILTQVILAPGIDITENVRRAFSEAGLGLYQPSEVLKRDYGIRCWSRGSKVDIECPPADTYSRRGPIRGLDLETSPLEKDLGVDVYAFQSTIVHPDTQLNRALPLADRQGVFTVVARDETYPMPLNQYDIKIAWRGARVVRKFDACQEQLRLFRIAAAIRQIDPEEAAAYLDYRMRGSSRID